MHTVAIKLFAQSQGTVNSWELLTLLTPDFIRSLTTGV